MARVRREGVTRKMSESNKVQKLKSSKKYAHGKEYNTLEGKIKIVNRYLENGEIMISYLNLETEEVVIKAELDVNAMLYAYTREIAQLAHADALEAPEGKYITEEVKTLREAVTELTDEMSKQRERYEKIIDQQFELIKVLQEQLKRG